MALTEKPALSYNFRKNYIFEKSVNQSVIPTATKAAL